MLPHNLPKTLFKLLVFILPTQLAFHFWPKWSFLYGIRIDYFAPAIYLTDILMFVFILSSFAITYKSLKFSNKIWIAAGFIFIFSLINIYASAVWQLALFKWLKLYELFFLVLFILKTNINYSNDFVKPLSVSVLFFSIITIIQFSLQKSIEGAFYFLGERAFNLNTVGISTVTLFGREFVRAYSTFSHPNSLGGFFLIAISILLFSKTEEKFGNIRKWGIGVSITSVLLSFSLASYLGLILLTVFYLISKKGINHIKRISYIFIISSLVVSLLLPFAGMIVKGSFANVRSVAQRLYLAEAAGRLIAKSPVVGVGLNNFIYSLTNIPGSWSQILQPVHNIFLLALSETGILGLFGLFMLFLISLKKSLAMKHFYLAIAILLIVFTGLFDHYWLTLNQNQLLLTLVLAFSFKS